MQKPKDWNVNDPYARSLSVLAFPKLLADLSVAGFTVSFWERHGYKRIYFGGRERAYIGVKQNGNGFSMSGMTNFDSPRYHEVREIVEQINREVCADRNLSESLRTTIANRNIEAIKLSD